VKKIILVLVGLVLLWGCQDTDLGLVAQAGVDAVRAITLSEDAVKNLAAQASDYSDQENTVAPASNRYARRLKSLVGDHLEQDGFRFDFKVYLADEVNAFAMADGTIRVYAGLMDMMDDDELRFVIGHEMGHVVKQHIRKKMRLAYAGSALRKGIASQENLAGNIARSSIGGFAEKIVNAQFSQQEEREADDYGLGFMKKNDYQPESAISALRKLATLGNNHSFLSSHPAPGQRADRLQEQLNQSS